MEEQPQPASDISAAPHEAAPEAHSETHSVMGSVADSPLAPSDTPAPAQEAPVEQGELRPIWPVRPGAQRALSAHRYALYARIVATACAALFFYVGWAPLANAITSGDLRGAPTGPVYRFGLNAAELGAPPLHALAGSSFFSLWSGLTIAGLLLSPLLWQSSLRWLRWIAIALYTCWYFIMTGIIIATAQEIFTLPSLLRQGGTFSQTLFPYSMRVAIYSISPAFGLWLALLAALLGLAAAALTAMSIITRRHTFAPIIPVAPTIQGEVITPNAIRPTRSLPGAGAITGGLILWAWGFFALPWATLNCSKAPLLIASCEGLPVASALQIGLGAVRSFFEPSAALYAITGLLLIGAVLILAAVWRRDITRTLCVWASLWLALALGSVGLAINGAQQVVANALSVGMPTGDWRADSGVLVVFLALVLVSIGLIPLWAVAIRAAQRRDAQRAAGL